MTPCLYSSPEGTSQTVALKRSFHVCANVLVDKTGRQVTTHFYTGYADSKENCCSTCMVFVLCLSGFHKVLSMVP